MARGYRFAARPGWLVGHLLVLAAVVAMILLGHWQLTVSERKGFSLQNFGYALQWWAFSVFALVLWGKILRDTSRGRDARPGVAAEPAGEVEAPVAYRRYVMPQMSGDTAGPAGSASGGAGADSDGGDATHAAYNAYLRSLSAQDGS